MQGFSGFPEGRLLATSIPSLFFSDVLPQIDDLIELKVTLHCFWLADQKRSGSGAIQLRELLDDPLLTGSLATPERGGRDALLYGLERAVARGTLLHATSQRRPERQEWYFINTEDGRQALEQLRQGDLTPLPDLGDQDTFRLKVQRPNIFVVYEQNIGMLTPLLAEELLEAERSYPVQWIEDAFRIAVEQNVRRWSYVRAILERWRIEGRDDETLERDDREDRYRHIKGKYRDIIKH